MGYSPLIWPGLGCATKALLRRFWLSRCRNKTSAGQWSEMPKPRDSTSCFVLELFQARHGTSFTMLSSTLERMPQVGITMRWAGVHSLSKMETALLYTLDDSQIKPVETSVLAGNPTQKLCCFSGASGLNPLHSFEFQGGCLIT